MSVLVTWLTKCPIFINLSLKSGQLIQLWSQGVRPFKVECHLLERHWIHENCILCYSWDWYNHIWSNENLIIFLTSLQKYTHVHICRTTHISFILGLNWHISVSRSIIIFKLCWILIYWVIINFSKCTFPDIFFSISMLMLSLPFKNLKVNSFTDCAILLYGLIQKCAICGSRHVYSPLFNFLHLLVQFQKAVQSLDRSRLSLFWQLSGGSHRWRRKEGIVQGSWSFLPIFNFGTHYTGFGPTNCLMFLLILFYFLQCNAALLTKKWK